MRRRPRNDVAMIRFLFRLLATLSLCVATILLVLDATRTIAASALEMMPLRNSLAATFPEQLAGIEAGLQDYPFAWDPIMVSVLALPGFVVFAVIALILYAAGHRTERRFALDS
nr:hypothetical protein [Mesorhizobium sp. NBSH29]